MKLKRDEDTDSPEQMMTEAEPRTRDRCGGAQHAWRNAELSEPVLRSSCPLDSVEQLATEQGSKRHLSLILEGLLGLLW